VKKLLIATAAFAALVASPALAADMGAPVYKAPPPPAPVPSWTGFYIGVNAGGSIGQSPTTDTGTFTIPGTGALLLSNESFTHAPKGGLAGGQIGYNWQVSPSMVLGLEVDSQWSGERDTATLMGCGNSSVGLFNAGGSGFTTCLADQQKLTYFGTARGRVGYATGDFLFYATGGGAWGTVKDNLAFSSTTVIANPLCPPPGGVPGGSCGSAGSFSHNLAGWTVGGGAEMKLWSSNWSAKVEYLYVDLGSYTDSVTQLAGSGPTSSFTSTTTSHFRDNIVRAGLNYRFDWGGH
jgi:outer membrane immunogenic protein